LTVLFLNLKYTLSVGFTSRESFPLFLSAVTVDRSRFYPIGCLSSLSFLRFRTPPFFIRVSVAEETSSSSRKCTVDLASFPPLVLLLRFRTTVEAGCRFVVRSRCSPASLLPFCIPQLMNAFWSQEDSDAPTPALVAFSFGSRSKRWGGARLVPSLLFLCILCRLKAGWVRFTRTFPGFLWRVVHNSLFFFCFFPHAFWVVRSWESTGSFRPGFKVFALL